MCLLITQTKPYNKNPYRYKVLKGFKDYKNLGEPLSSWIYTHSWVDDRLQAVGLGTVFRQYNIGDEATAGIHVFMTRKNAERALPSMLGITDSLCVVKVKVEGFLGAGEHINFCAAGDGMRGEVWSKAQIVTVYEPSV